MAQIQERVYTTCYKGSEKQLCGLLPCSHTVRPSAGPHMALLGEGFEHHKHLCAMKAMAITQDAVKLTLSEVC